MAQKVRQQVRRRKHARPYLVGGAWSLGASIAVYVVWLFGFIPAPEVPFLATVSMGVGIGIGSLIVARWFSE